MTVNKCRFGRTIRAHRGEGPRDKPTLLQFARRGVKTEGVRKGPTTERPYRPFLDIKRTAASGSITFNPDDPLGAQTLDDLAWWFGDGDRANAPTQRVEQSKSDVAADAIPRDDRSLGKISIGKSVLLRALLCASYLAPPTASRVDAASGGQRRCLAPNVGRVYLMPLAQLMVELQTAADLGTLDRQIQVFDQVDLLLSDDRARPAPEWCAEDTLERFIDKRNERARVALLSNRSMCEIASLFPTRVINAVQIGKTGWHFAEIFGPLSSATSDSAAP